MLSNRNAYHTILSKHLPPVGFMSLFVIGGSRGYVRFRRRDRYRHGRGAPLAPPQGGICQQRGRGTSNAFKLQRGGKRKGLCEASAVGFDWSGCWVSWFGPASDEGMDYFVCQVFCCSAFS